MLLIGFSRGHRADVGCPVHERVESVRPLQHPRQTDTRHLRHDGQKLLILHKVDLKPTRQQDDQRVSKRVPGPKKSPIRAENEF